MYDRNPVRLHGVRVSQMLFQVRVHRATMFASASIIGLNGFCVSIFMLCPPCVIRAARYGLWTCGEHLGEPYVVIPYCVVAPVNERLIGFPFSLYASRSCHAARCCSGFTVYPEAGLPCAALLPHAVLLCNACLIIWLQAAYAVGGACLVALAAIYCWRNCSLARASRCRTAAGAMPNMSAIS